MRDHAFTTSWHGTKPGERFTPLIRLICKCAYREGGTTCLRSWAEHGKPAPSEWRWHEMDAANAINQAPWGILDPSWFHGLRELNAGEVRVFLAFVTARNASSGESAPSVAFILATTGVSRSTVTRSIAGLIKVGLLTLVRRRSGRPLDADTYRLAPALRHEEIMAAKAERERKATASPKPTSAGHNNGAPTGGARPSQDQITPDLPLEERAANMKPLAATRRQLKQGALKPIAEITGGGIK